MTCDALSGLSGSVGIKKPDVGVSVGFVGVHYREPDTDAETSQQSKLGNLEVEGDTQW
jgi:hypothetical protein